MEYSAGNSTGEETNVLDNKKGKKSEMTNVRLSFVLFFSGMALWGQTPGTVTTETNTKLTVTAGSLVCIFNKTIPTGAAGVNFDCNSGGQRVLSGNFHVPVALTNGNVGSLHIAGDSITWIIKQEVEGTYKWQIAANGFSKEGAF